MNSDNLCCAHKCVIGNAYISGMRPTPLDSNPLAGADATMNFAFRAPKAAHPDVPALDILSLILGHGDSSRLVRRLRLENPLVTSVSAGNFNPFDEGLFSITTHFRPENFQGIKKILFEEIESVLTVPLDPEELGRAKLNLEADEIFSLETVDGLARKVGVFQTLLKDPNFIQKYLKRVHTLTPKDILDVARKYLRSDRANVTLMINEKEASRLPEAELKTAAKELASMLSGATKIKVSFKKAGARPPRFVAPALTVSKHVNPIVKHVLPNGALVILKRNPEIPIFHLKAGFRGGVRLEEKSNLGVTTLLSNTWTGGSANFSENRIAGIIEGCAGTISSFGGRNSIGLTLESLSAHRKEAGEVFCDVMAQPLFPQEIVEREAQVQWEYLRTKVDHPASVAAQIFMENIFRGHPYERDLNSGLKHEERFPLDPLQKDLRLFTKSEKEQSHIIIGYRGITFQDPDRYTLEVLEAILAGQGGRLFRELREKASLAYSVSPFNMKGIDTGYFGVYIGCSPEKGPKAIEMIKEELQKMVDYEPTEEEVLRAKRYLVGRNHIDLQRNGTQASSILFDEIYDIDCRETFKFADHLKEITAEDIKRLAGRLVGTHSVTVAVGPTQPW